MTERDEWAAARLKALRVAKGLTQKRLAELAGIDEHRYNGLERGRQRLTGTYADRLGPILGVEPATLIPPDGRPELPVDPLALLQELAETVADLQGSNAAVRKRVEALERAQASRGRVRGGR